MDADQRSDLGDRVRLGAELNDAGALCHHAMGEVPCPVRRGDDGVERKVDDRGRSTLGQGERSEEASLSGHLGVGQTAGSADWSSTTSEGVSTEPARFTSIVISYPTMPTSQRFPASTASAEPSEIDMNSM